MSRFWLHLQGLSWWMVLSTHPDSSTTCPLWLWLAMFPLRRWMVLHSWSYSTMSRFYRSATNFRNGTDTPTGPTKPSNIRIDDHALLNKHINRDDATASRRSTTNNSTRGKRLVLLRVLGRSAAPATLRRGHHGADLAADQRGVCAVLLGARVSDGRLDTRRHVHVRHLPQRNPAPQRLVVSHTLRERRHRHRRHPARRGGGLRRRLGPRLLLARRRSSRLGQHPGR